MVTLATKDGRVYSSQTAMAVSGLTYRQLDYCIRSIHQNPSGSVGSVGSGHQRRFTTGELIRFAALRHLLDLGIRHSMAWQILEQNLAMDLTGPVSINIRWSMIAQQVVVALSLLGEESLV